MENGLITPAEAEEQFLWFQSRPDTLAGSFRRGGRQQPGFGHVKSFQGKRFGMMMRKHGGRWAGPNSSISKWHEHDGHESGQQEVVPTEPSSDPDGTSQ